MFDDNANVNLNWSHNARLMTLLAVRVMSFCHNGMFVCDGSLTDLASRLWTAKATQNNRDNQTSSKSPATSVSWEFVITCITRQPVTINHVAV